MGKKMVSQDLCVHNLPLFICFRVKRNVHSWNHLLLGPWEGGQTSANISTFQICHCGTKELKVSSEIKICLCALFYLLNLAIIVSEQKGFSNFHSWK